MKKSLLLLLYIPIIFTGCFSLKQSKFKNKSNIKEFIISKYGKPNIIEYKDYNEREVWKYESNNILKNNRIVIFEENKIISNQKKIKTHFICNNKCVYICRCNIDWLWFNCFCFRAYMINFS